MDCALTLVTRGRPMKLVCDVLGVARSNVQVRVRRPADWMDRRRHRRPRDDGELVTEITNEIAALPSYGYRRAWEMVNRQRDRTRRHRVNHKRAIASCASTGYCFGGTPDDRSTHAVTTAGSPSAKATGAGARMASRSLATIANACALPLRWTAAIARR